MEIKKEPFRLEFFTYEKLPKAEEQQNEVDALAVRLKQKTDCDKYRDAQGHPFGMPSTRGYLSIDVLQFLWKQPLNDLVLAYVAGLHPSYLRISKGEVTCDSLNDRVTIIVDDHDVVQSITQSVTVGHGCGSDVEECWRAQRDNLPVRGFGGCIGHTASLERVDFQ